MQALIDVILPVFFVIGAGYASVWMRLISFDAVEVLMKFTQNFAIPCLLFSAVSQLDLSANFNAPLLLSFYTGAITGFVVGFLGARILFKRPVTDSIAIGFACLFSNSVLLGLPITERAYGTAALEANYAIVAIHAPVCYIIGMTTMEIARNTGGNLLTAVGKIIVSVFSNALLIGIGLGLAVNLLGLTTPGTLQEAIDMLAGAALPVALFGLGGVLFQYKPEGDMRVILFICAVSLGLHPAITWTLGTLFDLPTGAFRSAVLTAAMAPGVNAYIFASMYGVAKRVAATSVLLATALSVVTSWLWLTALP